MKQPFRLAIILLSLILCLSADVMGQVDSTRFPNQYLGMWKGMLEIYQGPDKKQEIPMSIEVLPSDSTHIWQWTLMYGADSADVREYLLIEKDHAAGTYLIDERNSIFLEANLHGNTLCSRFLVDHSLLLVTYRFEAEALFFEVFSGADNQGTVTGEAVEDMEKIEAWSITTRQQAILKRDR